MKVKDYFKSLDNKDLTKEDAVILLELFKVSHANLLAATRGFCAVTGALYEEGEQAALEDLDDCYKALTMKGN